MITGPHSDAFDLRKRSRNQEGNLFRSLLDDRRCGRVFETAKLVLAQTQIMYLCYGCALKSQSPAKISKEHRRCCLLARPWQEAAKLPLQVALEQSEDTAFRRTGAREQCALVVVVVAATDSS